MSDITLSFTFNPKDSTLKVQATNNNVTPYQLDFYLHTLIDKILHGEFMTEDAGDYMEETFKIDLE
jgi:hypothetical protein